MQSKLREKENNIPLYRHVHYYSKDLKVNNKKVNIKDETVWLNTEQMAQLFGRDYKTIRKHIKNALKEELKNEVVVAKFENTTEHGAIQGKTQTHDEKIKTTLIFILIVFLNKELEYGRF